MTKITERLSVEGPDVAWDDPDVVARLVHRNRSGTDELVEPLSAAEVSALVAALQPRSEGTTPAPATLDEDYAYEHARRLCDELRPIIEGDDLTRAVIRRYLTSAIVHGMQLHAQVTSSPGAVPEARPQEEAAIRGEVRDKLSVYASACQDPLNGIGAVVKRQVEDFLVEMVAEARSAVPAPQDAQPLVLHDPTFTLVARCCCGVQTGGSRSISAQCPLHADLWRALVNRDAECAAVATELRDTLSALTVYLQHRREGHTSIGMYAEPLTGLLQRALAAIEEGAGRRASRTPAAEGEVAGETNGGYRDGKHDD